MPARPLRRPPAPGGSGEGRARPPFPIRQGAWSAAWAWKKVRPLPRAAGHAAFTPTYAGLGGRTRPAHPLIDLGTRIQDVLAATDREDLRGLVPAGHGHGGMVATGVAGRGPERVRHRPGLDALVPAGGQSPDDLTGSAPGAAAGWLPPPDPPPPGTAPEDRAWIAARRFREPGASGRWTRATART